MGTDHVYIGKVKQILYLKLNIWDSKKLLKLPICTTVRTRDQYWKYEFLFKELIPEKPGKMNKFFYQS